MFVYVAIYDSYQGKQGWAPATFLQIYKGPSGVTPKLPTQSIGNVMLLKSGSDSKPKPGPGPGSSGRPQPPVQPRDEPGQLYSNCEYIILRWDAEGR